MSRIHVPAGSPFPPWNLPLGVGHTGDGRWRAWVAVGDSALDLDGAQRAGLFAGISVPDGCFARASLNEYLATGPEIWTATRTRLLEALRDDSGSSALARHAYPRAAVTVGVPVAPTDFVDFYSSIHHATNLGRLFRPGADPLHPNWRHVPIGYHGRTGTLVADGADIPRPHGHRRVDGDLGVGPSRSLDIELEVGTVIGVGSARGSPVAIGDVGRHLYGMCLVNDWSARDIQAFEYQPLGPFLGKSFATSVSPWLVSFDALAPFRLPARPQDPPPADHLSTDEPWAFDLHLEIWLSSSAMRAVGQEPVRISATSFADMYWTPAQQLTHLTVNGASTAPGDLFASGTVSGPDPGSEGSLIELTRAGEHPLDLPDGTQRTFLLDGDRVELWGWAGTDPETRIGLGSVTGTVVPSRGDATTPPRSSSAITTDPTTGAV